MASAVDVAARMLDALGCAPSMKLHRLLYCADIVHRTECGHPLIAEGFEEGKAGPVVSDLKALHPGAFMLFAGDLDAHRTEVGLSATECASIDVVVEEMGDWSSERLRRLVVDGVFEEAPAGVEGNHRGSCDGGQKVPHWEGTAGKGAPSSHLGLKEGEPMAERILEGAEGRLVDIISTDLPDEEHLAELLSSPWVTFPEGRFDPTGVNVGLESPYWDDRLAISAVDFRDLDGRTHFPKLSADGVETIVDRMGAAGIALSPETKSAVDYLRRPARAEAALADWLRSIDSAGDPRHMGRVAARVFVNSDSGRSDPARMPMDCFISFAPVPIDFAKRMAAMVAAEVSAGDGTADYFFEDAFESELSLLRARELDAPEAEAAPEATDSVSYS